MKRAKRFAAFVFSICIFNFLFLDVSAAEKKYKEPYINARYAVALDCNSKIMLYSKSADENVPIASTTKIITALVAIKRGNLDKKIEISKNAASIRGSKVGYKKGEVITLRELLYGLMMRSGNDAAIAIAEGTAGNVKNFSKLMNECAYEIGMTGSHFESPHGLDSEYHYSSAYDLALAACEAKKYKLFNDIVSSKDVDGKAYGFTRSYHNINKILWLLPNASGIKTGYTGGAGKCLVTSVKIKGNDVVIVVLNSTTRWKETSKINKYINDNYEFKKICGKGEIFSKNVKLVCPNDVVIPEKIGSEYNIKVKAPSYIKLHFNNGKCFGALYVYSGDKLIYKNNLLVKKD